MSRPIRLTDIPTDFPAREALEKALGKYGGTVIYKQIVDRVGKEPGAELGHGMKGVVYDLGDGRVLKLTSDASEIEAMTALLRVDHPNLVHVEDVFVVCRGQSGVGVVVREWVGHVLENIESMDRLNSQIRNATDEAEERYDLYRPEHTDAQAMHSAMEDLLIYLEDASRGRSEAFKIEKGLQAGIRTLMELGIYGIDFAPRNVAIDDGGNPVIFDVGVVRISARRTIKVARIGCVPERRIMSPG